MNSRRLGGNPVYPKTAAERLIRLEKSLAFGGKPVPLKKAVPKRKVHENTSKKPYTKIQQLKT